MRSRCALLCLLAAERLVEDFAVYNDSSKSLTGLHEYACGVKVGISREMSHASNCTVVVHRIEGVLVFAFGSHRLLS